MLQQEFQSLYDRELDQVIDNLQALPEDKIWKSPEGVSNSCGVLAQHIVGNLNHFIGKGMGNTDYVRRRDREFTNTGVSKEELISDIKELKKVLRDVLKNLKDAELDREFALEFPSQATNRKMLVHLYGHLNYHLGQLNYLRRILSENG